MAAAPHCANVSARGERRRRVGGVAALLAGTIVAAGLASRGAPPTAYLAVFPFAFGGAFGLLEARAKTCVVLAFANAAEREEGGTRRLDPGERSQVRSQAMSVVWKSAAIAAVVTLALVLAAGLTYTA